MKKIVLSSSALDNAFSMLSKGASLNETAKTLNLSSKSLLLSKLTETPQLLERYRATLISKAALHASEIVDIADDLEVPVDRAKLMVHARQWEASKILPALFGAEKAMNGLSVNVGNTPGSTIQINVAPMKEPTEKQVGNTTDDVVDV